MALGIESKASHKVLHHMSHAPSLFVYILFLRYGLANPVQAGQSSYLHLLMRYNDRHLPLCLEVLLENFKYDFHYFSYITLII
jgi:hypothetical protein